MKISVVLPTYSRPTMLRAALKSIRGQSRREWIAEVVVSENGLNLASRDICAEFPDLPIRYVYQETSITAYRHIYTTMRMTTCGWVAMLGDDDMWSRYHLEEAVRLLDAQKADAYAGQCVIVENESRQVTRGYTRLMQSCLPHTRDEFQEFWKWTPQQACAESLVRIPINLWTVVAKRDYLLKAFSVFDDDESYDCDRLACWRLATQGTLIIGREIGLYYRAHEAAWSAHLWREDPEFHTASSAAHTQIIMTEAETLGVDVRQTWLTAWDQLSPGMKEEVWKSSFPGARKVLLEKWGFTGPALMLQTMPRKKRLLHLVKQCIPPALWSLACKIKSR